LVVNATEQLTFGNAVVLNVDERGCPGEAELPGRSDRSQDEIAATAGILVGKGLHRLLRVLLEACI
jgi:hypothetical protein